VWPTLGSRMARKQNRTVGPIKCVRLYQKPFFWHKLQFAGGRGHTPYRARHTPQLCRLLNPTSPLVPKWLPTQVCSQMASGLVEPVLLGSRVCSTNRKTDRQTTDRITSVAVGRIYLVHAIWPKTGYLEQKCLRPKALPVIDQCKITFRPSSLN